jgi:methyl-accepting chemotaxis protein
MVSPLSEKKSARWSRTLLFKSALLISASMVVFGTVCTLGVFVHLSRVQREEAIEHTRAFAAIAAAGTAATPDMSPQSMAVESLRKVPGVAYVEVVGPAGDVLAHTFAGGRAPRRDLEHLREKERVLEDVVDGVAVFDVPAASSHGDIVHVGLDKSSVETSARGVRLALFAIGAAGFLLALGGALFFGRRLLQPLRDLTMVAQRAVEGDLTRRIDLSSDDEIAELAAAFRQIVEKLVEVLSALQDVANLLIDAGDNLSSSTQEQSQTITRQATALQETQVTAQEIKQTSLLAAQKAEAVLKLTEKADEVSTSGEEAIERSLGGLTDIRAQVEDISQRIAQLSERTQQIGSITATVKDLADQSNMLALNAAIEAVRSGEHGKGFAVVAREIRSLADQSIQATNRVREILEDIGGAIRGAVAITERGAQKIEGGLLQVKASGENLRELSNIVKDNSSAVRQIAAAVSQQNAGITQIFSAVTDQTKMMDETMRRLETTTHAASVLKDLSQRVSDVVRRFRVE